MERYDLIVIGGGCAGLKAARVAARAGRRVALAEGRELGGECFWAGCVPTKAMIRAAQAWHDSQTNTMFGVPAPTSPADFTAAMQWKDAAKRAVGGDSASDGGLTKQGVAFYQGFAFFEGPHEIRFGSEVIYGGQIIIATGTDPMVPDIPGLSETGYLTNREAVHLTSLPKRLAILGGGPIGIEFAQAFGRFGSVVTVIESSPRILFREEPEVSDLIGTVLQGEGVSVLTSATIVQVTGTQTCKQLQVASHKRTTQIEVDEILVAVGRLASTTGLFIERAGLPSNTRFIKRDASLRSEVPHIWIAGDVGGGYLFTHVASYLGRTASENAFRDVPVEVDLRVVPRVTFTSPETASIGLGGSEALEAGHQITTLHCDYADLDRPNLTGDCRGFVKLIVEQGSGQLLGGHIVGEHASSMIAEIALAMQNKLPIQAIASTMHAYPTFPEVIEAAALQFNYH